MSQSQSFNLMALLDELEPLDDSLREARLAQLELPAEVVDQIRASLGTRTGGGGGFSSIRHRCSARCSRGSPTATS